VACERALTIAPRYPDALSNLAICLRDLGQKDRAYQVFHETLAVDPDHRDALRHLARLCLDLGRPDEALECYKRRIDKAPHDVEVWCGMGDLYMSQSVGG
jgi:tetratricopeptide (TPR) repeat protein